MTDYLSSVFKWKTLEAIPYRVETAFPLHPLFSVHATLWFLKKLLNTNQHKSLPVFQFHKSALVILRNVSYVLDHCSFSPQPLLLYALESKYNKFQHIARAGVLCYFSAPRVITIETQLWWSVRAPREPPEARSTCSLMISYKGHNGSC